MSERRVALTFDAEHPDRPRCPPGNAQRILNELRAAGVRATFFVQGRWAKAHPDVARRIADEGHLVGHHSHYHARLPLLDDAGLRTDLDDDPRVLAAIVERGYRNVHWDVEVEDWEPWRTGPAIARDVVDGVRTRGDGSVVLLHTWPGGTGDAIGDAIAGLRAEGATFVTVDELERLP